MKTMVINFLEDPRFLSLQRVQPSQNIYYYDATIRVDGEREQITAISIEALAKLAHRRWDAK